MRNKLINIFNLSKLYIRENDVSLNIINMETKKINKKSALFWAFIILFLGIFYVSSEIINYTVKTGKPQIFVNILLLFLELFIIMRTIIVSINVFYFSKDIENVLHLPIKPAEILISKFNTILFMNYEIELLIAIVPLLIYGIYTYAGLLYFLNLIFILIIFPIFPTLIVSIIMIFLMKTIKLFKNKDLMQIVITFILLFALIITAKNILEYMFNNIEYVENNLEQVLDNFNTRISNINSYFLNINPSVNVLLTKGFWQKTYSLLKLFSVNIVGFILFILLGNKLYLRQLLKANFYYKKSKKSIIGINKKIKKKKIGKAYISKEFKLIFKNPVFFMQSIYPVIMITILLVILIIAMVPTYKEMLNKEEYKEVLGNIKFNIEAMCIILGATQFVGLFNYTSVTAFSREGKSAYTMKYLPISVYKQFIYKNVPQIIINIISSSAILCAIYFSIPSIGIKYTLCILVLSMILTIINSFILSIIDLYMPKLEWNSEYEVLKNNNNKILQYVLFILNILVLVFITKWFEKINLNTSIMILFVVFIAFLSIFNIIIYKNKNKLFNNIK